MKNGCTLLAAVPFYSPSSFPLKVLERWGPGGGKPFSKGFPPRKIPPRASASPWGRGSFCKRAPSPKPPSPKTLGEGTAWKCKRTAALFLQPFPFYFPILPLKVLEGWGPGGGEPFSKGFPPPQDPPQTPSQSLLWGHPAQPPQQPSRRLRRKRPRESPMATPSTASTPISCQPISLRRAVPPGRRQRLPPRQCRSVPQ